MRVGTAAPRLAQFGIDAGQFVPEPDAAVRAWLNDQAAETLYLSSVTLAGLLFGIRTLPTGRR
jgi:predicted nucleic acid-binding protein